MSGDKQLVRVDKHVKIVYASDLTSIGKGVWIDFDLQLSRRGTDFSVYANTGYVENTRDTDLLVSIINSVLTNRSGVSSLDVQAFTLRIIFNHAVAADDIVREVVRAAQRIGYAVDFVDLTKSN